MAAHTTHTFSPSRHATVREGKCTSDNFFFRTRIHLATVRCVAKSMILGQYWLTLPKWQNGGKNKRWQRRRDTCELRNMTMLFFYWKTTTTTTDNKIKENPHLILLCHAINNKRHFTTLTQTTLTHTNTHTRGIRGKNVIMFLKFHIDSILGKSSFFSFPSVGKEF
jgi:hypothetical protein